MLKWGIKILSELSAFFECAVPARYDKTKRKDCVNKAGMKKHVV